MPETKEEKKLYTYEEYLELEKVSEARMEYHLGEVYALTGSTMRHNRLLMNVFRELDKQIENKPCEVLSSDIKLELSKNIKYVYPDVMLTCSEFDLANDQKTTIRNPSLIIEVLTKSTEDYDRNGKFQEYIK